MQGVPEHFNDEKDSAQFRHLPQLPGVELYHAHISRYVFEPHTHEAFGIDTVAWGAERFRYRGAQHVAASGLTDQAHLTRAFARRYGITPARYQKQVAR